MQYVRKNTLTTDNVKTIYMLIFNKSPVNR